MRTTTTVWRFEPANAELAQRRTMNSARLAQIAADLAGDLYADPLSSVRSEDLTLLTVKRGWPDLATAEEWVAICIRESETTLNSNLVSVQVDPE